MDELQAFLTRMTGARKRLAAQERAALARQRKQAARVIAYIRARRLPAPPRDVYPCP